MIEISQSNPNNHNILCIFPSFVSLDLTYTFQHSFSSSCLQIQNILQNQKILKKETIFFFLGTKHITCDKKNNLAYFELKTNNWKIHGGKEEEEEEVM